jgi:hypothetical protein
LKKWNAGGNITLTPKPTFLQSIKISSYTSHFGKSVEPLKVLRNAGSIPAGSFRSFGYSPQANAPCKRFRKSNKRRSRKSLKAKQPIAILRGAFKPLAGTIPRGRSCRGEPVRIRQRALTSGNFSEPFHLLVSP